MEKIMPSSSRKFTPLQPPTTSPKLVIPRSEAKQKLEAHIEKGHEIVNRTINSKTEMDGVDANGETWQEHAIRLLASLFDTNAVADEFSNQTRSIGIAGGEIPYEKEREFFRPWMASRVREVESILESLDLFSESPAVASRQHKDTSKSSQAEALEKIELIANRFHIVARQLRHRHNDRSTLIIENEYDVQDLFHALLRLFFDDIRDEEWTPSYAGGASRIDFLLKAEQVVIELKMTRAGLKAKEVSDQLIIDTDRYQAHPDYKMLIAFVYDPQEYLNNPRGIEHDLTKLTNSVPVKVIINPR
ncbi:MAG: hypothetical protein NVSMB38_17260 [Ktedonobacteraceae bacterium]